MQNVFVKAEEFVDHIKEYVNNRIAAVKLSAAERSSKILSNLVAMAIVAAIMFLFVIFLSLAIAYSVSDVIGPMYSGFLVVAGIWFLVALLVWTNRERMLRLPIMNKMLHQMFKDEDDPKHT